MRTATLSRGFELSWSVDQKLGEMGVRQIGIELTVGVKRENECNSSFVDKTKVTLLVWQD